MLNTNYDILHVSYVLSSQSAAVPTSMLEALISRRGFPAQYYAFTLWLTAPISKNEI